MRQALAMSALMVCAAGFTGCGEASADIVYLHVLHGYAGSPSISLYGPEGAIVSNLSFGEATEEPLEFNRENFDGTLTLVMEGVPGAVPVSVNISALYPQETATLIVQRRTGLSDVAVNLIRHIIFSPQGSRSQCIINPTNQLSLEDGGGGLPAGTYSYMVQLNASQQVINRLYNPSLEQSIPTECGPILVSDLGLEGQRIQQERAAVFQRIAQEKYLYPALDPEGRGIIYVAGNWVEGTSIFGPKTSAGFIECLTGAVQLGGDEASMDPNADASGCSINPGTGALEPPTDDQGNLLVTVDAQAISECFGDSENYQGFAFLPGQETITQVLLEYPSDNPDSCSATFRIRTPFNTYIYDQGATLGGGREQDAIPSVKLAHPSHTAQSIVLYGRPLDPLIHQFTHAERSEPTGEYPGDRGFDPEPPNDREEELPGRDL